MQAGHFYLYRRGKSRDILGGHHDGDTYRAVYTVRFEEAVYVLHVFQKKATEGIKTPQRDIDLIQERLQQAQHKHAEYLEQQAEEEERARQSAAPSSTPRKQKGMGT